MSGRKPKYTAIIFDLDGLVLDTEIISKKAWIKAASDLGFNISGDLYEKVIGITAKDTMAIFSKEFGEYFPAEATNSKRIKYIDEIIESEGIQIKPGFLELSSYLNSKNVVKAIATSSTKDIALKKLRIAGIESHFSYIATGDQVSKGKPQPDLFLKAAAGLGICEKLCIAFEDSDDGTAAAHSAGMKVIIVPDLKQPSVDSISKAEKVFESLENSIQFLEDLI